MHQNEDIFGQLRDLETAPPPELKVLVAAAYTNKTDGNSAAIDIPGMNALAEFHVEPPPAIKAGILQRYIMAGRKQSSHRSRSRTIMASAASLLICVLVVYWIFQYAEFKGDKPAISHSPVKKTDSSLLVIAPDPTPIANQQQQQPIHGPAANHHNFSINGTYGALVNNDLWLSILEVQGEAKINTFLFNENTGNKITLDNFTTIKISPSLAKTINESRAKKKNGKPTIKARWTKRKLEKLKKQEAGFFKVSSSNNPLNPVHLSNFMEQ